MPRPSLSASDAVKARASVAPTEDDASSITGEGLAAGSARAPRVGRYRWVICALLFFATTINYIDRQVFGILAPEMKRIFGWTDSNYTDIVFWFEVAYAIGQLGVGRVLDWIGTRVGFALAMIFWSAASMLHAGMATITRDSVWRDFSSAWVSRAISPHPSRRSQSGFPSGNAHSPPASSIPAPNVGAIVAPLARAVDLPGASGCAVGLSRHRCDWFCLAHLLVGDLSRAG